MNLKRGLFLVVVVLLIGFSSLMVIGEEPEPGDEVPPLGFGELAINDDKYYAVRGSTEDDDLGSCDNNNLDAFEWFRAGDSFRCGPSEAIPADYGCWARAAEWDSGATGDDECGWAKIREGYEVTAGLHSDWDEVDSYSGTPGVSDAWGWGDDDGGCALHTYNFRNDETSKLCSDDHFWHTCGSEETLGTITWANNYLYECVIDEVTGVPKWEQIDIDVDHDGYVSSRDCDDNSADDPSNCPTPDSETGQISCQYPLHSQCAICINPGAPEVCGDSINNDCGGITVREAVTQLAGNTPDYCNNFREGCEQKSFTDTGNLEPPESEEEIPWINSRAHTNIYNEQFSWVGDADGRNGRCCGIEGIQDLGDVFEAPSDDYICFNKNLVGVQGGNPEEVGASWGLCGGSDWCWVSATGDAQFKVYTLNAPGTQPFDVVSNSEKWQHCVDSFSPTLPKPLLGGEGEVNNYKIANRFYCYQEGRHWSWAECYGPYRAAKNENTIKGRVAGEGLYNLYLTDRVADDGVTDPLDGALVDNPIEVNTQKGAYTGYYGETDFDFYGFDHLEFMLKFVKGPEGTPLPTEELFLPVKVMVEIYGPEQDDLYVYQNALGYIINSPLFAEDNWMHIKMPIPNNLLGVTQIKIISSPEANLIAVKNIRVTKIGEPGDFSTSPSLLCSGKESSDENSWLFNIDQGVPGHLVNGEELCKSLYGPNAWLGDNEDTSDNSANCCGNDLHEYYAGSSKENEEGLRYGCWNSQPIADKDTTMNVEFSVEYNEEKIEVSYPKEDFFSSVYIYNTYRFYSPNSSDLYFYNTEHAPTGGFRASNMNIYDVTFVDNFEEINSAGWWGIGPGNEYTYYHIHKFTTYPRTISYENSPLGMLNISVDKYDFDIPKEEEPAGYLKITSSPTEKVDVFFINPLEPDNNLGTEIKYDDLNSGGNTFFGMAKTNENYDVAAQPTDPELITTSFTYTCSPSKNEDGTPKDTTECLYPLPGEPPYIITNPNPELYELFFVTQTDPKDGIPVGSFLETDEGVYGNIRARRVAQQVVFHNEGLDAEIEPKFFGCEAADYLKTNVDNDEYYEELNYCDSRAGKFCAYSVEHKGETGSKKERFTTINSWSDETITKVGYKEIPDETENVEEFYENNELELKLAAPAPFTPDERNFSTSVLPARNFISNAEFLNDGSEIPHWEILPPVDLEREATENGVLTLNPNQKLVSERIAVPRNVNVKYSGIGCLPTITLVDKDGKIVPGSSSTSTFNTGSASYLRLEYSGSCTIEKPMLQIVDDKGVVPYYSILTGLEGGDAENGNGDARAGVACCPQDHCWNGYACVEPMSPFTYLAEHIAEGRDYRCINGEWKSQPVKFDWNQEKWGFCDEKSQCFVLSSNAGADNEHDFSGFYEGDFPTCINNEQFLFDNYCEDGSWTSRTKFIASKLLEVGESDNYVLYCTNYKNAFNNFDNFQYKEDYLGGSITLSTEDTADLPLLGEITPEVLHTCFEVFNGEGEGPRLVPTSQKTTKNTCINNVCVLKSKSGTVAFATTLNKDIGDENSFLAALNIPQHKFAEICPGSEDFVKCKLEDTGLEGDLWYSPKLNAIIYSKDGIDLNPTILDNILTFFSNLFGTGSELSDEEEFLAEAQNYRELYFLEKSGKKVRAIQEILSTDEKQMLIAEYENFDTPVCDYVNEKKNDPNLPEDAQSELLGPDKFLCTHDGNLQRVETVAGLDFFWPQLTGQLRTQ